MSIVQVHFLDQTILRKFLFNVFLLRKKNNSQKFCLIKKNMNERTPKWKRTLNLPKLCKIRRNTSNFYRSITPQICSNNSTLKRLFLFSRIKFTLCTIISKEQHNLFIYWYKFISLLIHLTSMKDSYLTWEIRLNFATRTVNPLEWNSQCIFSGKLN